MPNIFPPPAPVADASVLAETSLRVLKALKAGTSVDPKHRTLGKNGLRGPQGFALIETVKAALGVGVEKGDGVLIKVLGFGDDDVPKLSAPLPVKTKKFGLGLSIGVNQVYTALLMHSDAELDAVVKGEHVVGKDVDIPGYENPSRELTGFHKSEQSGATAVSVSDSMMLMDFSLSGGKLSTDHDVLKAMYGEAATAEEVLSGSVPTPPQFADTYKYLAQNFMMVEA